MATRVQKEYAVTLTWRDGKVEQLKGWGTSRQAAAADAMNSAGYGGGALGALDCWDATELKDEHRAQAVKP